MWKSVLSLVLLALLGCSAEAPAPEPETDALPSADELLERSIAYHDPDDIWASSRHHVVLQETRPGGTMRDTAVVIDNRAGYFEMTRHLEDGPTIELQIHGDEVTARLDGSESFSAEEAETHRLTPDAAKRTRNYYAYLYGLPMKLRDPGTRLDPEVTRTTFQGRDVLSLRVTYDEDVGGDIWYFYLDPESAALVGYRFYHDESKNDGEYIVLEGEAVSGNVRLPKARTWHVNADDKLLGTDTIVELAQQQPGG